MDVNINFEYQERYNITMASIKEFDCCFLPTLFAIDDFEFMGIINEIN